MQITSTDLFFLRILKKFTSKLPFCFFKNLCIKFEFELPIEKKHYWNGFSQSFSSNKHLLLSGISFFVGGRNINRRKPGGDWRWIKHGSMTKMKYFAFGKGEPDGAEQSPQDCMLFHAGDRYKFHDSVCGKRVGGYICEV